MQKLLLIALTLVIALTTASIPNSPVLAEDSNAVHRPVFAALSPSADSCGRFGGAVTANSFKLGCRANSSNRTLIVAVTCSANQWCCKHDDFSKGTCVKCCQK